MALWRWAWKGCFLVFAVFFGAEVNRKFRGITGAKGQRRFIIGLKRPTIRLQYLHGYREPKRFLQVLMSDIASMRLYGQTHTIIITFKISRIIDQMYNQRVIHVKSLPIPLNTRKPTDVICTCLHFLSVGVMLAFAVYCMHDAERNGDQMCRGGFKKLWNDDGAQFCVEECGSDRVEREGVCFPEDSRQLDYFLSHSPYRQTWERSNMIKVVAFCAILVVSLAMVVVSISYFAGRILQRFLVVLAVLGLGYLMLSVLEVLPHPSFMDPVVSNLDDRTKKVWLLSMGIIAFGLLTWLLCFNRQLSWNGMMMDLTSRLIPERIMFVAFAMEYYLKAGIIFAIFAFQHYAFTKNNDILRAWLTSPPSFTPLVILNMLEFIWNLQFIKDTLYFQLSTMVNTYYCNQDTQCCDNLSLTCRHSGSISGGSLVNALFTIPNCILDWFCCFPKENRENCALWYTSFTGIARSDAYAYQSLAGIPYCNSSRECRRLLNENTVIYGVNSPLSNFRLFFHIFVDTICLFFSILLAIHLKITFTLWLVFIILAICELCMSGIIDLLLTIAESLQTVLFVDFSLSNQPYSFLRKSKLSCPQFSDYLSFRPSILQP